MIYPSSAGIPVSCSSLGFCVVAHCLLVKEQAKDRPLVLISGFIHDVSSFMDEHPGGIHLVKKNLGKDATTAFFGGVYDHSNAAHNVSFTRL